MGQRRAQDDNNNDGILRKYEHGTDVLFIFPPPFSPPPLPFFSPPSRYALCEVEKETGE